MEREIRLTGIGGQGIQLAARTLAEAAIADGRRVQLFASYGGMMRGGNSDSMLVVADDDIVAPPVIGPTWAAVIMHHQHADPVWAALRPGGVAAVNSSVVEAASVPGAGTGGGDVAVVSVRALDLASELGVPVAASLVLVGALAGRTGIVTADALLGTVDRVLPSYRAEAATANRRALELGLAQATLTDPAWVDPGVPA